MAQNMATFYSGSGFSDWEIGDITVIKYKNKYHLFHLIIPNHDYIAHAVSTDGFSWTRVKNALFVGDPGEWDDDMLWTMHVCEVNGRFEMYYTGLHRQHRGVISRIGLAVSDDLYQWEKIENHIFPFESQAPFYENIDNNPRKWLSFRDPYRFEYNNEVYYLLCARAAFGPISRRGCVGLVKQTENQLEYAPPLHYPMVYDDVECPCVFKLNGHYYLLGSIREDIKVRYWFANDFIEEYQCFHNNVLLPQGNYAARTVIDGEHTLVYTFFYTHGSINSLRILPPPKELDTDGHGKLILKSYYRWEKMVTETIHSDAIKFSSRLFNNPTSSIIKTEQGWTLSSRSGYEIFCFKKPLNNYIWEAELTVEGMGKLGIVSDIDEEGNGYYYSLDVANGYLQLRGWGFNPDDNKSNFKYQSLQDNTFKLKDNKTYNFSLLRYGNYIELSIDGEVKLTLIDLLYNGDSIGLYTSSSSISVNNSVIKILPDPEDEYLIKDIVSDMNV
ncbi:MAG: glycosyl hydrolase family 32 [Niabella sp.]